ncbi:MAG TPA: 23S rRNA (pseudouridine(1915)-N(3))-methyltransferase RlmH [Gammaproteobacteria bacterium]|nr:23S rRNA (pseudouridine(1915)-N(3))-methyltransferase RlmH [Gammaproteobacteria bacterium]
MQIHLIAVGTRLESWVDTGYQEYAKRLPRECALRLVPITPGKRTRSSDPGRAVREEGERMLAAIPRGSMVVALDVAGRSWSTGTLADQLRTWLADGRDRALLIGGPDGLWRDCEARAEVRWSLSALTLPHPLVRILVAEQLYRAWSIVAGHPYHRG